MSKRTVSGITLTLVLIGMLTLAFNIQPVKAATIIVPDDYPTIQEAVDAADPWDVVLVSEGTYPEGVTVNKSLTIIGEEANSTIVHAFEIQADNVTISSLTIRMGVGVLVYLHSVQGCNVSNNVMRGGWWAVALYSSSNNLIADNNIFALGGVGMQIQDGSDNNIIRGNYITEGEVGILLIISCSNNTMEHNKVTESDFGISVRESSGYNKIENNIVAGSTFDGIEIAGYHNSVRGNVVANNSRGISIPEGNENRIYHNNLINNPGEVVDSGQNFWDSGAEGNYWDDYNGTDLDGDGIGDTYLPWRGVDYYPLMSRYWNPADVNHDLKVNLYDAVLVLVTYGSKLGDENYNPHSDIAEPYGIINLYDAILVLANYGKKHS